MRPPCCRAWSRAVLRDGEGGAAGDVGEGRHAEEGGGGPAGHLVELGELGVGSGKADFQSFDFAVPSFAFRFGDTVEQVAADLGDPRPLVRGWPQERASQARVLMDAGRRVRPPAFAERDTPPLEMTEEFFPLFVAGSTVFLAGTEASAAGDEGPVAVDDFLRVDG